MNRSFLWWAAAAIGLAACGDDDSTSSADSGVGSDSAAADGQTGSFTPPANLSAAIETYANIVRASYEDSLEAAEALDTAIDAFLASPTEQTLIAARTAWLASREPYLQTEVYRFYDGPIDNPTDGPEGLLNAWPMDEAFVDYVEGDASAGVINAITSVPNIDASTLEGLNEAEGNEANVATGYHPIEFLLWGQDLSETGPGERAHTDYVEGPGGTVGVENEDRRGDYLATVSDLLRTHLTQVRDAWAADTTGNFRESFESADPLESFEQILTGMIVLSGFETAGERLQTALDSGDQEDEHSCFSDNTHRDMVGDALGIQNVYEGRYTRLDDSEVTGTSVYDVVAEVNKDLADQLRTQINASVAAAEALQPPFDQEIAPSNSAGNERVRVLITALRAQEMTLFEVFNAFALSVEIPE